MWMCLRKEAPSPGWMCVGIANRFCSVSVGSLRLLSIVGRCFPNITRAQVYECLAYYEDHRGEIDVLVARQMVEPIP